MTTYQLSDLDVFHITFDEPNAEANWQRIKQFHPSAKRMHGAVGFDRAHKACALASSTPRLVTIDGDNWINSDALNSTIDDTDLEDVCFSFKSRNAINGLEYGNGGIKCWHRDTLLQSHTHEAADTTDFCWDIRYFQVDTITSTTVQNCTAFQAWRAGYREGVKMSYIDGRPLLDFARDWRKIWKGNLGRLMLWCTVGRDVENGIWAMCGARMALTDVYLDAMDYRLINDYAWFRDKWHQLSGKSPDKLIRELGDRLLVELGFYLPDLDTLDSEWLKLTYMNPTRQGLML